MHSESSLSGLLILCVGSWYGSPLSPQDSHWLWTRPKCSQNPCHSDALSDSWRIIDCDYTCEKRVSSSCLINCYGFALYRDFSWFCFVNGLRCVHLSQSSKSYTDTDSSPLCLWALCDSPEPNNTLLREDTFLLRVNIFQSCLWEINPHLWGQHLFSYVVCSLIHR